MQRRPRSEWRSARIRTTRRIRNQRRTISTKTPRTFAMPVHRLASTGPARSQQALHPSRSLRRRARHARTQCSRRLAPVKRRSLPWNRRTGVRRPLASHPAPRRRTRRRRQPPTSRPLASATKKGTRARAVDSYPGRHAAKGWRSRKPQLTDSRRWTRYSHSIVAGGFPEMSYVTREMPFTSLMILSDTRSRNSYGSRAQRAVMKSTVSTARSATT